MVLGKQQSKGAPSFVNSAQDSTIIHTNRRKKGKGAKRSGSRKPLGGSLESGSQSRSRSPILISNRNYPDVNDFIQNTAPTP